MTEFEIVQFTRGKLEEQGKNIYLEIPFLTRCIDMVIIEDRKIISIEFKISDWRKAIKQARDHLLGVDKAYICLPARKKEINKELRNLLEEYGIGLYFFYRDNKNPLEEIIPAKKSKLFWPTGKQWLKETITIYGE